MVGDDGYSGGNARDLIAMTKVLVIDDEAPIRLLCRVNLEAEGMSVIEAADGPSGLDKARDENPDVILLDVMMPGLDGWRVAEHLLDDERTVRIPIIFLTARAEFRDRARASLQEFGGGVDEAAFTRLLSLLQYIDGDYGDPATFDRLRAARAEFRDRARGLDIGGIDYITKPFNPLELAPLVEGLLERIDRGEKDELRAEKLSELRSLMESE